MHRLAILSFIFIVSLLVDISASNEISSVSPHVLLLDEEFTIRFTALADTAEGDQAKWLTGTNCATAVAAGQEATIDSFSDASFTFSSTGSYNLCYNFGSGYTLQNGITLVVASLTGPALTDTLRHVETSITFTGDELETGDRFKFVAGTNCHSSSSAETAYSAIDALDTTSFTFSTAGTFNLCVDFRGISVYHLVSSVQVSTGCPVCPPGQYDNGGTCEDCPAGQECPDPSADPVDCTTGFFSTGAQESCTLCDQGETSALDFESCVDCDAGSECSDPTNPTECTDGYYSAAGASVCLPCPGGQECSGNGVETPEDCADGEYSLGQAGTCTTCPEGFFCATDSKDKSPVRCDAGEFSDPGASTCRNCAAGSFCPATYPPTETACSEGEYSLEGSTECTVCPPGSACPDLDTVPTACDPGTYSESGAIECLDCPVGYACPNGVLVVQCVAPFFSLGGDSATACEACPAGEACDDPTTDGTACADGWFSLGNQRECTPCPPGYECPDKDALPQACPDGEYSTGYQAACTSCTAGMKCPTKTRAPTDARDVCPPGTYSNAGATTCTTCPEGSACPNNDGTSITTCDEGTFSVAGSMACMDCPLGFYQDAAEAALCKACEPGKFSADDRLTCEDCPAGSQCANPLFGPVPCEPGYYSGSGQKACTPCEPGNQCPDTTTSEQCPDGFYSYGKLERCLPCTSGYYCTAGSETPTPGTSVSDGSASGLCPAGSYCDPPSTIQQCPAGTYNPEEGASHSWACLPCPPGYYCERGASDPTANDCPVGYWCPEGTPAQDSFPCPPGTYNDQTNQVSKDGCQICPAGRYCDAGIDVPVACPDGHYCPPGTISEDQYPCPAGRYVTSAVSNTGPGDCTVCDAGSYCPEGSAAPIACPTGTTQEATGAGAESECVPCPPGKFCPDPTTAPSNCDAGYYCPRGSSSATEVPCPAGTFSDTTGLASDAECTICPLGQYCLEGATSADQQDCPAGHYCPLGTRSEFEFPCPAGTFRADPNGESTGSCGQCDAGSYCPEGSDAVVACEAGHACPAGTRYGTEFPCPAGKFTAATDLQTTNDCDDCTAGNYCPEGSAAELPCPAGRYSEATNTELEGPGGAPECTLCPAGSFCVEGADSAAECSAGEYSSAGKSACSACEPGHFCTGNGVSIDVMQASVCVGGTYCDGGDTDNTTPCSDGHYCPRGTTVEVECPPGKYTAATDLESADECTDCDAGSFCEGGDSAVTGGCTAGHYCPTGSYLSNAVPCPAGTFAAVGGATVDDCDDCTAGNYCPIGSDSEIACPDGYYCPANSGTPTPCPLGSYDPVGGDPLTSEDECTACDPGKFCDRLAATEVTDDCDKGYYCVEGSTSSAPQGLPEGGLCPKGGYCPAGSFEPTGCDVGTYNSFRGASEASQCISCPAGWYCDGTTSDGPTDQCEAGYVCVEESIGPRGQLAGDNTEVATPEGTFAPIGSGESIDCEPGTYQDTEAQDSCKLCSAGSYCPDVAMTGDDLLTYPCDAGHYCEEGSLSPEPCPIGRYRADPGATTRDDCTLCDAGTYCPDQAMTATGENCLAGFFCESEASTPTQSLCSVGHYCEAGTTTETACGEGTYNPNVGGESVDDCLDCDPGRFCEGDGNEAPSVTLCDEGYYCEGGSPSATPSGVGGDECPAGSYCPEGAEKPIPCDAGTYTSATQQSECSECDEGSYCGDGADSLSDCGAGNYCPAGSKEPTPCPRGTYGTGLNLVAESACTLCPAGQYCPDLGMDAEPTTNDCSEGFFCAEGALSPEGDTLRGLRLRENLVGWWAMDESSGTIALDSAGSSNGVLSNFDESLAWAAGEGSFARKNGLLFDGVDDSISMTILASDLFATTQFTCAMWIRLSTAPAAAQTLLNTGEFKISLAADGTVVVAHDADTLSSGGTIADTSWHHIVYTYDEDTPERIVYIDGSADGNDATASAIGAASLALTLGTDGSDYFGGILDEVRIYDDVLTAEEVEYLFDLPTKGGECPVGAYCEAATSVPAECPPGSYMPYYGATAAAQCVDCDPGSYCETAGLVVPTGVCDQGYWCAGAAEISQETDCSATGVYCPEGSDAEVQCGPGTYQDTLNSFDCKTCSAGFYQDEYSASGCKSCPEGYFCLEGARRSDSNPCPEGTYNDAQEKTALSDCLRCEVGYYCEGEANTVSTGDGACNSGYYCLGRAKTATPELPEDTYNDCRCKSAWVFDGDGQTYVGCAEVAPTDGSDPETGADCDEGDGETCYWCEVEGVDCGTAGADWRDAGEMWDWCRPAKKCPLGHYCDNSEDLTTLPIPCPAGTYSPKPGAETEADDCDPCPLGQYCIVNADGEFESLDCDEGFFCMGGASTANGDDATVRPCSLGHYCEAGTISETECTPGTFADETGLSACKACTAGFYCPENAMGDGALPLPCPDGAYCPEGSDVPLLCPVGTYSPAGDNDNTQVSDCTACDAGSYCSTEGLSAVEGDCEAGYYCAGRSVSPTPTQAETTENGCTCLASWEYDGTTYEGCSSLGWCYVVGEGDCGGNGGDQGNGGADYWDNCSEAKECPTGHYCEVASTEPSPCPAGKFAPSRGLRAEEECVECLPGYACTSAGLEEPNSECISGYYCPGGQDDSSPSDYQCEEGHYCPTGSASMLACPRGQYQDSTRKSSCKTCPGGSYCAPSAATTGVDCPNFFYCEAGSTDAPSDCAAGYHAPDATNADSSDLCEACPTGQYCNRYAPKLCAPGFICVSTSDTPTPDPDTETEREEVGRICPIGHYCEAGTDEAVACSEGLFSVYEGGNKESDCKVCAPGFKCSGTSSSLCPAGEYCPGSGEDSEFCPSGTYSGFEGSETISNCRGCRQGFFCDEEGISDFGEYLCPLGHYCPEGVLEPIPCPPGTFRHTYGGVDVDSCATCQGGFYCPEASHAELECDAATYCLAGAGDPVECPPGYFCPGWLEREQIMASDACLEGTDECACPGDQGAPCPCPAGWYCPAGASLPVRCEDGKYCPAGSTVSLWCPLGTKTALEPEDDVIDPETGVNLRGDVDTACELCPAGTYGADPSRQECTVCPAGYVCLEGCTSPRPSDKEEHNGYQCPTGHYCPEGTTADDIQACPAGSYNERETMTSEDDCVPCSPGSYSPQDGEDKCLLCGASAESVEGATLCTCIGANRAFQQSTAKCLCKPGFEYFDESGLKVAQEDSPNDCQPIVYDRCGQDDTRTVQGGCEGVVNEVCTDPDKEYSTTLGVCTDKTDGLDSICDADCRSAQPYIAVDSEGTLMYCPTGAELIDCTPSPTPGTGFLGNVHCDDTTGRGCKAFVVAFGDTGAHGKYDPTFDDVIGVETTSTRRKKRRTLAEFGQVDEFDRRRVQSTSIRLVPNPVMCLELGETVVFRIEDGGKEALKYPVYVKDSLFNTNGDFDYGFFKELQDAVEKNNTVKSLAFTFSEEGVYTFADSAEITEENLMIIRVLSADGGCPSDARIATFTANELYKLGVMRNDDILLKPDWPLIIGIIAGVILVVGGTITLLRLMKHGKWGRDESRAHYRTLGKNLDLGAYTSKGSSLPHEMTKEQFFDFDREIDLEGFSMDKFYQSLEAEGADVKEELELHTQRMRNFYDKVTAQTDELKKMLAIRTDEGSEVDFEAISEQRKKNKADLKQRQDLAAKFAAHLRDDQSNAYADDEHRDQYVISQQVAQSDFLEVEGRIVESLKLMQADSTIDVKNMTELEAQLRKSVASMKDTMKSETHRRGIRTEDEMGASLVEPLSGKAIEKSSLFDSFGNIVEIPGVVQYDAMLNLYVPSLGAKLQRSDGSIFPAPGNCFIHPSSGKVLPVDGNVAVDPGIGEVIVIESVVLSNDEHKPLRKQRLEVDRVETLLPFIPTYGQAPLALRHSSLKPYGQQLKDNSSSLMIPILAASVDPATGHPYPVAGVTKDLVMGHPAPITLDEPMVEPVSGRQVPIAGLAIDFSTAAVIPAGGLVTLPDSSESVPIAPGTLFREPISGNVFPVGGASMNNVGVVHPFTGGRRKYMDATELDLEWEYVKALEDIADALSNYIQWFQDAAPQDIDGLRTQFETVIKGQDAEVKRVGKMLDYARERNRLLGLNRRSRVVHRTRVANKLRENGGSEGKATDEVGSFELVVGAMMKDMNGTSQFVPIIQIIRDKDGNKMGLGGTYKNLNGQVVPIKIGEKFRDKDGEIRSIVGVKLVNGRCLPVGNMDEISGDAVSAVKHSEEVLEEEIAARATFVARQDRLEDEMSELEDKFRAAMLQALNGNEGALHHIKEYSDSMLETVIAMDVNLESEIQRRNENRGRLMEMGEDVYAELTAGDNEEIAARRAHLKAVRSQAELAGKHSSNLRKAHKKLKEAQGNNDTAAVNRTRQEIRAIGLDFENETNAMLDGMKRSKAAVKLAGERSGFHRREAKKLIARKFEIASDDNAATNDGQTVEEVDPTAMRIDPKLVGLLQGLLNLPGGMNLEHLQGLIGLLGVDLKKPPPKPVSSFPTVEDSGAPLKEGGEAAAGVDDSQARDEPVRESAALDFAGGVEPSPSQPAESPEEIERRVREKHEQEKSDMEEKMEREIAREMEELQKKLERQKQSLLEEQKKKIQEQLKEETDEEMKEKLMTDLHRTMARLNQVMDAEKNKQEEALMEKLRLKKERRAKALERKQELEAKEAQLNVQDDSAAAKVVEVELNKFENQLKEEEEKIIRQEEAQIASEVAARKDAELQKIQDAMEKVAEDESLDDEEKQRVMQQFDEDVKKLDARFATERDDQEKALREKLAAKRRKKKLEKQQQLEREANKGVDEQKQAIEEEKRKLEEDLMQEEAREADEEESDAEDLVPAELSEEQLALERENERMKEEIEQRQEEERKRLEEELAREEEKKAVEIAKQLEAEKQAKLAAKKKEIEEEIARKKNLTNQEKERLLEDFESELKVLEGTLDNEKLRQEQELQAKIAAKKRKRQMEQQKKHDLEMQREVAAQEQETTELKQKIQQKVEQQALQEVVNTQGAEEDLTDAVAKVMKKRHQKASDALVAVQEVEKAARLQLAFDELDAQHETERKQLALQHEDITKEMEELGANEADMAKLKTDQQMEKHQLNETHASQQFDLKNQILSEIDAEHTAVRVQLREKQLQEIQDATRQLTPEEILKKRTTDEKEKALKELSEFREKIERERLEAIERIKKEKAEFDLQQRKKMDDELQRFEKEIEDQRKSEEDRARSAIDDLNFRKQQLLEAKRTKQEEEMANLGNVTAEMKEKILKEHEEERATLENQLEKEKQRQKEKMEKVLAERRQQRRKDKIRKTQDEFRRKMELKKKHHQQKMATVNQESVSKMGNAIGQALSVLHAKDKFLGVIDKEPTVDAPHLSRTLLELRQKTLVPGSTPVRSRKAFGGTKPLVRSPLAASRTGKSSQKGSAELIQKLSDDKLLFDMLLKSPLYEKLKKVEAQLQKGMGLTPEQAAALSDRPKNEDEYYWDERDQKWVNEGELEAVNPADLSADECLAYKFAFFIANVLSCSSTILVASTLPKNNWSRNCFRNSFFYDPKGNTIHLRRLRLEDVGQLGVLLCHIVAHIEVNDFADDSTDAFLAAFYNCLSKVCGDGYVSRIKASSGGKVQLGNENFGSKVDDSLLQNLVQKS